MKLITVHNRGRYETKDWRPRKMSGTVVLEQPEADMILGILADSIRSLNQEKITINIGAAFLHSSDQLNKKEGRRLAQERVRPIDFSIEINDNASDALWLDLLGADLILEVNYRIRLKIYRDDRKLRIMKVETSQWRGS